MSEPPTLGPLGNQARLYTLAAEVLRENNNDVSVALPLFAEQIKDALLTTLAGEYLNRVASDIRFQSRPKPVDVAKTPVIAQHHKKMPTPAQRRAEIEVGQSTTLFDTWKIGGRKIGDLYVHELRELAAERVASGFATVVYGQQRIFNGAACQLITQHVVTCSPMQRVRDIITAETLKRIERKAQAFTKRAIDKAKALSVETLREIQMIEQGK